MTTTAIPTTTKAEDLPNHPRAELEAMRKEWRLGDLLLGGTPAMKNAPAGEVVLQEEGETPDEFKVRVSRGVLTNYYGDTIDRHSALPFRTPIKFDPPLPPPLQYLETNCDGSGRSITALAREVLREGMHRGMSHILVDAKPVDPQVASLADDLARRPLLLHIKPNDLLDAWDKPSANESGEDHVVYARLLQSRSVDEGRFGKKPQEFVLELDPVAKVAREWVSDANGAWSSDERVYDRESVPLFTFYAQQEGEYSARPAYRYLAELNLAHFQSDVDQRHGLSYGRRSTVVQTGWVEQGAAQKSATGQAPSAEGGTRLGFARRLKSPSPDADAKFLETGGAGLAAGQVDLDALEKRMERFGAAQVSREGGITATSRSLDDKRDNCNLEAWCTRLEGRLLSAVRAIAEWRGIDLPSEQKLSFDRSFAEDEIGGQTDMPLLIQMAAQRMLPRSILLDEARARKLLRTSSTNEEIVQMLAEERDGDAAASMEALVAQQIEARNQPPQDPQNEPDQGGGQTP